VLDNATIRRNVGAKLRAARGNDRSLRDIADAVTAAGIRTSAQSVSMWENGVSLPSPATQRLLAAALGRTHGELFGLDDEVA
jgi:transcriptional regulator with XRE-family HTH domain